MIRSIAVILSLIVMASCGMVTDNAPVPQPDTQVFGTIVAVRPATPQAPAEVEVQVGLPSKMQALLQRAGKSVPEVQKGLIAKIKITTDTVCVADATGGELDVFKVGQDIVALPVKGTTAAVGTRLVLLEAAELYIFTVYQKAYLPRMFEDPPLAAALPSDPQRINSAGLETVPLPLQNGKILYFAAGLRSAPVPDRDPTPIGAIRVGMKLADGKFAPWAIGGFRPYRTAYAAKGWDTPSPVEFGGLSKTASARVTWINDSETSCLVEVMDGDIPHQLFSAQRKDVRSPWGAIELVKLPSGESNGDAQRFGKQGKALVWTAYDESGSDLWLSLENDPGKKLDPRINTLGSEWAPRNGPGNILFFDRGDRQLLFEGGVVHEVRLPGTQRRVVLEAAPTANGRFIFVRVPRYNWGGVDWDLAVVKRIDKAWGTPVPLDDWHPE